MAFNADGTQMVMLIQAGTPVEMIRDDGGTWEPTAEPQEEQRLLV
jgi:hypothetical protein